eukprot:41419-Eustigmatos_ZCMA.PRE.1
MTSFKVIEGNDWDIELLKEVNCETKEELFLRERYHIETTECVNSNVPIRTQAEWAEYHKKYYEEHKEIKQQYDVEYRRANAEAKLEYFKAYCEANGEMLR